MKFRRLQKQGIQASETTARLRQTVDDMRPVCRPSRPTRPDWTGPSRPTYCLVSRRKLTSPEPRQTGADHADSPRRPTARDLARRLLASVSTDSLLTSLRPITNCLNLFMATPRRFEKNKKYKVIKINNHESTSIKKQNEVHTI